jgi:hypothetical protein
VFLTAFLVAELVEPAHFVQLVLNVLDNARRSVLDQVVHGVEGFEDAAPVFRLLGEDLPQVLHDVVVVLPVVGVVG